VEPLNEMVQYRYHNAYENKSFSKIAGKVKHTNDPLRTNSDHTGTVGEVVSPAPLTSSSTITSS